MKNKEAITSLNIHEDLEERIPQKAAGAGNSSQSADAYTVEASKNLSTSVNEFEVWRRRYIANRDLNHYAALAADGLYAFSSGELETLAEEAADASQAWDAVSSDIKANQGEAA